jgi:hypothetical protein
MPSGFIVKADASNVGLLPPELDFICCSFMAMDSPELEALASRLELAAITDSHLSMASEECPQQGPMFRNEVMYMSYIIRVWMGTIVIKDKCEDTFYNWVKEIQGSSIDNPGIHKKLLRNFGSPKANKDENAFKLATGRILANASIERIKGTYSTIIDEVVDGVSNRRLGAVMGKASESCIYSKIGERHMPVNFPPISLCILTIPHSQETNSSFNTSGDGFTRNVALSLSRKTPHSERLGSSTTNRATTRCDQLPTLSVVTSSSRLTGSPLKIHSTSSWRPASFVRLSTTRLGC